MHFMNLPAIVILLFGCIPKLHKLEIVRLNTPEFHEAGYL